MRENRRRAAAALRRRAATLLTAYQIHSAIAADRRRPLAGRAARRPTRVVTATPGLVCGALAADCAPVLLADAEARVVAAAHAGWKGALGRRRRGRRRRAWSAWAREPARMRAAVGPCIGPAVLRGRPGVPGALRRRRPGLRSASSRPARRPDKRLFDLPAFVLGRPARRPASRPANGSAATPAPSRTLFFSNRRAVQARRARLRPPAVGDRARAGSSAAPRLRAGLGRAAATSRRDNAASVGLR